MWKVIVVEDEALARKGIIMTLDWKKYDCLVVGDAKNGKLGLELIRKYDPDIIISDIRMPVMTGIEMILQARKEGSEAEAIMISAYSEFEYAQQALRAGAVEYLLKPFQEEELENAVSLAVQRLEKASQKDATEHNLLRNNIAKGGKNKYVEMALEYIDEHYADPNLTISDIAEAVEISDGYLSRTFHKETEYTLIDYLTRYRLQIARTLLQDIRVKVYEVAQQVGYNDTAYFSTLFKKYYGVSPSEYQARGR